MPSNANLDTTFICQKLPHKISGFSQARTSILSIFKCKIPIFQLFLTTCRVNPDLAYTISSILGYLFPLPEPSGLYSEAPRLRLQPRLSRPHRRRWTHRLFPRPLSPNAKCQRPPPFNLRLVANQVRLLHRAPRYFLRVRICILEVQRVRLIDHNTYNSTVCVI